MTALGTLDLEKLTTEFVKSRGRDEYKPRENINGTTGSVSNASRPVATYSAENFVQQNMTQKFDTEFQTKAEMHSTDRVQPNNMDIQQNTLT